jgi:uncharacterized protein
MLSTVSHFSADRLDELVADSATFEFPAVLTRDLSIRPIPKKADVLIGVRRTGKSSMLHQHAMQIISEGVAREQVAFFNFDNLAFAEFSGTDLLGLVEAWYKRFPKAREQTLNLLLDEIQGVDAWERAVRQLIETKNLQLSLTGSSAKLLAKEIATSLRGRSVSTQVWPFSLGEAMRFLNEKTPNIWPASTKTKTALAAAFDRYLLSGGFPEVIPLSPQNRKRVLSEYVDVTLVRDVIERHEVSNVHALRRFVAQLLRLFGRKISVNKIAADFASQGVNVSKNTLYDYQAYLEDAYFFFFIPIFSVSPRKQQVNPKKGYAIDPALVRANSLGGANDHGLHLENLVYIELRRRGLSPTYFVSKRGSEVDFVVQHETIADAEAREREVRAIEDAKSEHPDATFTVLTAYEAETITLGAKRGSNKARVLPYYEWALRSP